MAVEVPYYKFWFRDLVYDVFQLVQVVVELGLVVAVEYMQFTSVGYMYAYSTWLLVCGIYLNVIIGYRVVHIDSGAIFSVVVSRHFGYLVVLCIFVIFPCMLYAYA